VLDIKTGNRRRNRSCRFTYSNSQIIW
jgi:hypothetical protein